MRARATSVVVIVGCPALSEAVRERGEQLWAMLLRTSSEAALLEGGAFEMLA